MKREPHDIEDSHEGQWRAETWYSIARALEALAADKALPRRLRQWFSDRAEAAWVTGDWRNGISPEMWAAECAIYQAEEDAMVAMEQARAAETSAPSAQQLELAMVC